MTPCSYCSKYIPTIEKDGNIIASTLYWNKQKNYFYCNASCSLKHHTKLKEENSNGISIKI